MIYWSRPQETASPLFRIRNRREFKLESLIISLSANESHCPIALHLALKLILYLPIQTKNISRFQHIRSTLRPKDLLALPPPLRMIDPINIVLNLHNHTAILLDDPRSILDVKKSLCGFEGHGSVLPAARVHLEGVLVGEDVDGDAGPGRGEGCYGGGFPAVGGGASG